MDINYFGRISPFWMDVRTSLQLMLESSSRKALPVKTNKSNAAIAPTCC